MNVASYFEIPVTDMPRAIEFYSAVFEVTLEEDFFDNLEMAYFPLDTQAKGISGALVKGEIYKPTTKGVLLYFNTFDIEQTIQRVVHQGAKILFPIHRHENAGFAVAEFEDSEGNRIGLHQILLEVGE
ncbi:VOC family protein [Myroides sp. TSA_177.3]|uniref:VOC family protein n=1 Tax=Myroides sp. TSA_177.3 TaxID=3415650 RepID=UPI0040458C99